MNLLTSDLHCIECGCTDLIKDYTRQEIYCSKCGLVLADTTIPTIEYVEQEVKAEQSKEDYYRFRRFLYDMEFMKGSLNYHNG